MPGTVFPGISINVMSPSLSFDGAISTGTTFTTLELAYLRERALYDN